MQDQKIATLTTVLSEVLADLAFMFTDDGDFTPSAGERWMETSISYEGSTCGSLRLTCTGTFGGQLAANLLGLESSDETTKQESDDAVKEFMNVTCGQFVTAAYGTEDIFNLTIPEVLDLNGTPEFGEQLPESEEVVLLSVDGQLIELHHFRNV